MNVFGLLTYVCIQGITPGPSNFMSFYSSATYGIRGAKGYLFGTCAGFFVKMLLCGLLDLTLAAYVPQLVPYLKWFGAAYLVYLALHIIWPDIKSLLAKRKASADSAAAVPADGQADVGSTDVGNTDTPVPANDALPTQGITTKFSGGILLQVMNIKSWLMGLTLYSVYIIPYSTNVGPIFFWTVIVLFIMILCTLTWASFGNAIKRIYATYRLPFDIVMTLLLLYSAVTAAL